MRCPHCRADVPDRFSFCPQCGVAVRTETGKVIRPDGARRVVNTVLIGVLVVNVIGGAFLIRGIQKKNQSAPDTTVEELQAEESKAEKTTETPKETKTEKVTETTTKATTTKETTIKETDETTKKTEKKTTKETQTTKVSKTTKTT